MLPETRSQDAFSPLHFALLSWLLLFLLLPCTVNVPSQVGAKGKLGEGEFPAATRGRFEASSPGGSMRGGAWGGAVPPPQGLLEEGMGESRVSPAAMLSSTVC